MKKARAARRGVAILVAIMTVAACGGDSDDERAGRVSAVAEAAGQQPGRWTITIELDDGTIAGSSDVQVAFDAVDLVCDDGSGVVLPSSLSEGDRLTFITDPNAEVETMDPPIVAGERVVVLCSQ